MAVDGWPPEFRAKFERFRSLLPVLRRMAFKLLLLSSSVALELGTCVQFSLGGFETSLDDANYAKLPSAAWTAPSIHFSPRWRTSAKPLFAIMQRVVDPDPIFGFIFLWLKD